MRLSIVAAALVMACALPARAQVMPGADCAGLKNQGEMAQCYDKLKSTAEGELRETENKLAGKLGDAKIKASYQAAAKAWAEYRDRECAFETGESTGASRAMALSICLTDKTGSRVEELARQLDCPSADPTCVH